MTKKNNKNNQNKLCVKSYDKSSTNKCVKKSKKYLCNCEQLFYEPLPCLPIRPINETVKPIDWFSPGTIQTCCSICSSVKPIYFNH